MKLTDLLLRNALDRRISAYQNDLMQKHVAEVENIYKQMRGWRHDYHNHIQTLKAYQALGQGDQIGGYLNALESDLTSVDTLIKSGNVMVDAILNSKLSLAASRGIGINASAVIPGDINLSEIDLCVIVGNLLDNAIEGCLRLEDAEQRFIRVYMDLKRDNLYLSVTNASGGTVRKRDGRYVTGKPGSHGFGLMRVDKIVNKYGGFINRNDEDGVFTSEVMLPLS